MSKVAALLLVAGLAAPTSTFAGQNSHTGQHFHWGNKTISLAAIGTYKGGGAEISAYDAKSKRVFVTSVADKAVDVLDIQNPSAPFKLFSIGVNGEPTSVTIKNGLVAIAVPNDDKEQAGTVEFYDADGNHKRSCAVGYLPDMVTFSPDGKYVLVANEGEPTGDAVYNEHDPEGSISVIDVKSVKYGRGCRVETADFARFNPFKAKLQTMGVRIYGPGSTVAQDLEPEYITVSADSRTAWVSLQENNALAVVDIPRAKVVKILPLGLKDHSKAGNALDASDRDGGINISNWPEFGMYQPDGIASYVFGRQMFIISTNEGDARDYDAYAEEERIKDVTLDPTAFPNASDLRKDAQIGRLTISTATGDLDNDGDFDQLHVLGARSFSIWTGDGKLVYDSGDALEQKTATLVPSLFNSSGDTGTFDTRSDNKGPEPEGVAVGEIDGETYAFIGLERTGGVMVYNVTNPYKPSFVTYVNNAAAGDVAPEGLHFIAAKDSPNRKPLLVVTNEVSTTTTIYEITAERTYASR